MKTLTLCALILLSTCVRSRADDHRFDCAAIRYYVAVHGIKAAEAYAKARNWPHWQIERARRCLAR